MAFRALALLAISIAAPSAAQTELPQFDGRDGYRVVAPFKDGLLVQDRQGASFLCDTKTANRVVLTNCRPIQTQKQVQKQNQKPSRGQGGHQASRSAPQDLADRKLAERTRLSTLPPVAFEQAAREVLQSEGCQVRVSTTQPISEPVLRRFAAELNSDRAVVGDLYRDLDELFVQSLDLLLSNGDVSFDRQARVARLNGCRP